MFQGPTALGILGVCTPLLITATLITLHPGIDANDHMRQAFPFFPFLKYFYRVRCPVSCPFSIQSLPLPYQPFPQALRTCCCPEARGLCSAGSLVLWLRGAVPCAGTGAGTPCSASPRAGTAAAALGAVSGKEQMETAQWLLYIWHRRRICYPSPLGVRQIRCRIQF